VNKCLNLVAGPENKMAMILGKNFITFIHDEYRSGFTSILVLEEIVETVFSISVFYFDNPIYESFNRIVGQMDNAGLLNYWKEKNQNSKSKQKVEDIGPQVLTMNHLEIGFQIYLVSLTISIAAFIAEIVVFCANKVTRMMKNFLVSVVNVKVQENLEQKQPARSQNYKLDNLDLFKSHDASKCNEENKSVETSCWAIKSDLNKNQNKLNRKTPLKPTKLKVKFILVQPFEPK
jgi:hypothetical protein